MEENGRPMARKELVEAAHDVVTTGGEGYELLVAKPAMGELVVPEARSTETYRLVFEGFEGSACALVSADAQVVHQVSPGGTIAVHDLSGQYYSGARFFAKTAVDEITVTSRLPVRSPYAIRDAKTWELLYRTAASDAPVQTHRLGKGRMVAFIVGGDSPHSEKRISGIEPYVARSLGDWFEP